MLEDDLDLSIREWIERYQRTISSSSITYKGVPIWKNVLDLWIYQEIVFETQPEIVVEIGCKFGGSAMWLADLMRTVGSGDVLTVDLLARPADLPSDIRFYQGDSTSPEIVERITTECAGKRTMIIADSNHSAEHVLEELRLYSPLVQVGGYFVVEDGIVDVMDWKRFTPGPVIGVNRFLAENDRFVIDRSREKFGVTYNPGSFLKRIK